jgi:tol-pal system protein YbgF
MMSAVRHSGPRTIRVAALALVFGVGAAGCATKSDVRLLQQDINAMRARQDSLFRESQRQTRLLLDTLRTSFAVQQDVRGETQHRFQQLEQVLSQVQEMLNQTQLLIAQLNERLERQTSPSTSMPVDDPTMQTLGAAESLYATAMKAMGEGSLATARAAFEEIVTRYPNEPRAPDAQFQIAQTYLLDQDFERAIQEFEKVERQWHNSPRAPDALLQAGIIAQERLRQASRARGFFNMVLQMFPASDAATVARQRLSSRG